MVKVEIAAGVYKELTDEQARRLLELTVSFIDDAEVATDIDELNDGVTDLEMHFVNYGLKELD